MAPAKGDTGLPPKSLNIWTVLAALGKTSHDVRNDQRILDEWKTSRSWNCDAAARQRLQRAAIQGRQFHVTALEEEPRCQYIHCRILDW